MKKLWIAIFFLTVSLAQGQSLYQFLENASNARALGLAGAYVSMAEDPAALFYNPATLTTAEDNSFSVTFMKHVLDINSGNAVYFRDFEFGSTAASLNYTSYGNFEYADKQGNILPQTFSANNFNFGLSYANIIDTNFYYGVTAKVIYVTLEEYGASAFAFDAGLFYQIPDKRLNLGLSVLNAGFELSGLAGYSNSLPLDIRLGLNHRLRGLPLLVNFNFHHLNETEGGFFTRFENFSVGGELYLGESIRARLGYDNRIRVNATSLNDKGFSGISGGVGVVVKDFKIDYGVGRIGSAATIHKFSIGFAL